MSNASFDGKKGSWILQFQPMNGGGRPRSIRVRADRLPSRDVAEQKRLALALAEACDRACRLLEVLPTPQAIRDAERMRAITPDQAKALLTAQPVPPPRAVVTERLTLERAALMHPSSGRESTPARRAHLAYLHAFSARTGILALAELTLPAVQDYLAWMVTSKMPWDTRRHRLMYLRRASRMGATHGLPDVLGGLVLDKQGPRPPLAAWSLPELADGCAVAFENNPRARMAVALGGFLGLRSSEIIRVRCGDLRLDGMLPYASARDRVKDAKNEPSRRILPVPPTIIAWMRALAAGRGPDEPLIYAERGWPMSPSAAAENPEEARRRRRRFTPEGFAHWLGPKLEAATGRDLPPKALRKSFANWATQARLPASHIEQFLGHENTLVASITGRHYLTDALEVAAKLLKPTATRMEKLIVAALAKARHGAAVAAAQPSRMVQG